MALTGEVSDLSLAELIEFFCNQRKTGRLKLIYPTGPAYFYLQSGSVVHARIGTLRGIEAVFYALTLPNASFTFSPAFDSPEQTINQPWTSVVLEGLRRMDEGIRPRNAFSVQDNANAESEEPVAAQSDEVAAAFQNLSAPKTEVADAFFAHTINSSRAARPWSVGLVAGAVVLIIAAVGVPWGWYARSRAAKATIQEAAMPSQSAAPDPTPAVNGEPVASEGAAVQPDSSTAESIDAAAKRQREARARERAKAQEAAMNSTGLTSKEQPSASQTPPKPQASANAGAKRVTVQVTYDENGRVTQASGGDPTALRIARQKRFPAGKPGSATITIPIN